MLRIYLKIWIVIAALCLGPSTSLALPKCPSGVSTADWHDCFGIMYDFWGWKYSGEFKNGNYNGQGTGLHSNGDQYIGNYLDNKKHGQGIFTYADGSIYAGEWKSDKKNGQGTLTQPNGILKKGTWGNNNFLNAEETPLPEKETPPPEKSSFLKETYLKQSKDSRLKIQTALADLGLYKSSIDGVYGAGTDKALNAYNKQKWNNLDLSKLGNTKKLINSVLILAKRASPRIADPANGSGKTVCPGSPYDTGNPPNITGDWTDCVGREHWAYAGSGFYSGGYKNGSWHGQGTFVKRPGEEYVGEWKDGSRSGEGKQTYPNGTVEEGIWEDDEFQG